MTFMSDYYITIKYIFYTLIVILLFEIWKKWKNGNVCNLQTRLDGQVVVITGGNTGLGKATAVELAKRGARIILACRDEQKGILAKNEVIKLSANSNVSSLKCDLSDTKSIRNCAAVLLKEEANVNILINNAGVMFASKGQTKDEFETHFGINHLGHFLLTHLLMEKLKESSPSRVINVSARLHSLAKGIRFNDISLDKNYSSLLAYGHSKLANILFTKELAKRYKSSGVHSVCLHPGVIMSTELCRNVMTNHNYIKYILNIFSYPFVKSSPWYGAQTTIYCALLNNIDEVNGGYFSDCKLIKPSSFALDTVAAERLWDLSCKMLNIYI